MVISAKALEVCGGDSRDAKFKKLVVENNLVAV
jgi:hypothetical protein